MSKGEALDALRPITKRPSWVTYSESKLDPSRSVPGLGTEPPDFYGDETWKSQTVLTLSTHPALVINVAGVRFPRCLPESKTASGHLRRGSLSSPYTFLSAGYPSETSSVAPLRAVSPGTRQLPAGSRLATQVPSSHSRNSPVVSGLHVKHRQPSAGHQRPSQTARPRHQVHIERISHAGLLRPPCLAPTSCLVPAVYDNALLGYGHLHTTAAWDEGRVAPTEPGPFPTTLHRRSPGNCYRLTPRRL